MVGVFKKYGNCNAIWQFMVANYAIVEFIEPYNATFY